MKIYGLRIYPQSVKVALGPSALVYTHRRLSPDCTDFLYLFRPLVLPWSKYLFATDFAVSGNGSGGMQDPTPQLRARFGASFFAADMSSQIIIFRGDGSEGWAKLVSSDVGLLPAFPEPPRFDLLKELFWDPAYRLTSETWPVEMRAVLHNWDDVYWQLFTTERADAEGLLRAHADDQKLRIYFVDLDREYPNPSNQELRAACLSDL